MSRWPSLPPYPQTTAPPLVPPRKFSDIFWTGDYAIVYVFFNPGIDLPLWALASRPQERQQEFIAISKISRALASTYYHLWSQSKLIDIWITLANILDDSSTAGSGPLAWCHRPLNPHVMPHKKILHSWYLRSLSWLTITMSNTLLISSCLKLRSSGISARFDKRKQWLQEALVNPTSRYSTINNVFLTSINGCRTHILFFVWRGDFIDPGSTLRTVRYSGRSD